MGPPPPPPPPPSQLTRPAVVPQREWKAANASRRDDNTTSSAARATRPSVDAAALQHAAARLRKTGNNEQIRGHVSCVSDGRVDGSNQCVSGRDRQDMSQQQKLGENAPREQVYAAPARAGYTSSRRDILVDGRADPISSSSVASAPYGYSPRPSLASTNIDQFDSTPKSLYKNFNPPASTLYEQRIINRTASPDRSSSSVEQTKERAYSPTTKAAILAFVASLDSPATILPPYEEEATQVRRREEQASEYAPINKTRSNNNNNSMKERQTNERTYEWSEPYAPRGQPILEPQAKIHEYATTTYVRDERQPNAADQFARQLHEQGLTPSQRYANQFKKSHHHEEQLPFDASALVQASYSGGDEVDRLVRQMHSNLAAGKPQAGRRPSPAGRDTASATKHTTITQKTTSTTTHYPPTTAPMSLKGQTCVGCGKEVTNDKPGCTAMDKIFHVACFVCQKCQKVLAGASFYNIDGAPTCEGCYLETLDKCNGCGKTITDKLLRACGGTYHVDCFVCVACKKTLDGVPFTVDSENAVHCVPCFHDKFAPRCAVCSKAIVPREGEKESVRVVAMDKSFHVDCYKCEDCDLQLSSKIEGQGCYPLDGHLLCKICNGNRLRVASAT